MKKGFYVTITEIGKYYGKFPFKAGEIVKISKDKGNGRRGQVRVSLPMLGTVGYLATQRENLADGTLPAERIYKRIGDFAYAQIMFVTEFAIIAKVLLPKEVERTPYIRAYIKKRKKAS